MGLFVSYVLVVGGFTASVQVIRGVVRGAGKLIEGEPKAALVEVAGGVMAPVASAVGQACKLGADVCRTAGVLAVSGEDESETLPAQPTGVRRWRAPGHVAPEANGV
jgi:predicted ThiF/HesA family dinucleotide-utilizing enzyme